MELPCYAWTSPEKEQKQRQELGWISDWSSLKAMQKGDKSAGSNGDSDSGIEDGIIRDTEVMLQYLIEKKHEWA